MQYSCDILGNSAYFGAVQTGFYSTLAVFDVPGSRGCLMGFRLQTEPIGSQENTMMVRIISVLPMPLVAHPESAA